MKKITYLMVLAVVLVLWNCTSDSKTPTIQEGNPIAATEEKAKVNKNTPTPTIVQSKETTIEGKKEACTFFEIPKVAVALDWPAKKVKSRTEFSIEKWPFSVCMLSPSQDERRLELRVEWNEGSNIVPDAFDKMFMFLSTQGQPTSKKNKKIIYKTVDGLGTAAIWNAKLGNLKWHDNNQVLFQFSVNRDAYKVDDAALLAQLIAAARLVK